jgi:hypothetical protein
MEVQFIDLDEYKRLWDSMKETMRFETPNIDPITKCMTVDGFSGKGTAFNNEYDRLMYEHFNPPMSKEIQMWTENGLVIYRVETR